MPLSRRRQDGNLFYLLDRNVGIGYNVTVIYNTVIK